MRKVTMQKLIKFKINRTCFLWNTIAHEVGVGHFYKYVIHTEGMQIPEIR
jgi:hypothetical protein